MKHYVLFAIVLISASSISAQTDFGFQEGYIVKKGGDSIHCFIERAITYNEKIIYKTNLNGIENSIPSQLVMNIISEDKFVENVQLEKHEKLMTRLIAGNVQLFNHISLVRGFGASSDPKGVIMYSSTIRYALKKDNIFYEVRKKNFHELLSQVLRDCSSVSKKLKMKEYQFKDLEMVVNEYNSCKYQ